MEGGRQFSGSRIRKRKAEQDNNERLSKRLSRLDLSHNERRIHERKDGNLSASSDAAKIDSPKPTATMSDDTMRLDDTKDKVYIYNLDDELSSSDDEAVERVRFHPDLEKHLQKSKIPTSLLANRDGELAGINIRDAQLVLYDVPKSLTVPEGQVDSVRKAIIETRARARAAREAETKGTQDACKSNKNGLNRPKLFREPPFEAVSGNFSSINNDPDAMDID